MRSLKIFLSILVLAALSSFTTSQNMRAPDCAACLVVDGYSDPGEPWGFEPCYSLAEGYSGQSN